MTRLTGAILIACAFLSGCGGGSDGSSQPVQSSQPSEATAVIQATSGLSVNPTNNEMQAVAGRSLQLSASGSTDVGSRITAYQWSVASRPSGSNAAPTDPTSATTGFTPDLIGSYVL